MSRRPMLYPLVFRVSHHRGNIHSVELLVDIIVVFKILDELGYLWRELGRQAADAQESHMSA
jgi:hypothetical protein